MTNPETKAVYLGEGGRLRSGPSAELVEAGFRVEIGHAARLAWGLSLADIAHAVALVESKILPPRDGERLLQGLLDLHRIPGDTFPWKPELGDAFNSREAELSQRIGAASGWLSAGRPRREAFRVALRLVTRRDALRLHKTIATCLGHLLTHARSQRSSLACDYTYLQPAQPTTVGHLLLSYAAPMFRSLSRLRRLDDCLGQSVAGAGGTAGSRWPLSRRRLAELLGCHGLVSHTKDAAWQADVYIDLLSLLALHMANLSQLGQDFEIYTSQEFDLVSLADHHSRASALMPQKKNPYALAVLRTQAGVASGDLAAALVTLHTGTARTDHFHLLNGTVPRSLEEVIASTELAAAIVRDATFHALRFRESARAGGVTASDLADVIAMRGGVDYRTAHRIVGRLARSAADRGESLEGVSVGAIDDAARDIAGRPLELGASDIEEALDPEACVSSRSQSGSCSPENMTALLDESRASLLREEEWREEKVTTTEKAWSRLLMHATDLAGEG